MRRCSSRRPLLACSQAHETTATAASTVSAATAVTTVSTVTIAIAMTAAITATTTTTVTTANTAIKACPYHHGELMYPRLDVFYLELIKELSMFPSASKAVFRPHDRISTTALADSHRFRHGRCSPYMARPARWVLFIVADRGRRGRRSRRIVLVTSLLPRYVRDVSQQNAGLAADEYATVTGEMLPD